MNHTEHDRPVSSLPLPLLLSTGSLSLSFPPQSQQPHHESSGSGSNDSNGTDSLASPSYVSPIASIIQDLRRRNASVVASYSYSYSSSGATTSTATTATTTLLTSTAADPWEEMDAAGGFGPWGREYHSSSNNNNRYGTTNASNDPSSMLLLASTGAHFPNNNTNNADALASSKECKCRTMRRRMSSAWKSPPRKRGSFLSDGSEHSAGVPAVPPSNLCPFCTNKRSRLISSSLYHNTNTNTNNNTGSSSSRPPTSVSPTSRSRSRSRPSDLSTATPTTAFKNNNNHAGSSSGGSSTMLLEEPQHAEALLECTPQLRFLSPASTDMQGAGKANSSNIVSFFIQAAVESTAKFKDGFASSDSSFHAGAGGGGGTGSGGVGSTGGNHSEYIACLARDRANHDAATELASLLWVLAHEMSLEDFGTVENQVCTTVFAMVHSNTNELRMAGIASLDALLVAPSADEERKAIRFANSLSNGLRTGQGDFAFLSAVSKALGHMAMRTANVDFVESEVTRGLEWLRTERPDRRLAACLILKEIATYVPTTFHSKTSRSTLGQGGSNEFLDHIFEVMRDPQPIVRVCAADALSQCLKILVERQHPSLTGFLCMLHFNLMEGLQEDTTKKKPWHAIASTEASQHGSLLAVSTMLAYTRDFMLPRFEEVCRAVLACTKSSRALIRLEAVRLVPRLARRHPQIFGRRYLEESLVFLMQSAATPPGPRIGVDLRPAAFASLGRLILAMTDESTGLVIGGSSLPTIKISDDPSAIGRGHIVELSNSGIIFRKLPEIFSLVRKGLQVVSAVKNSEMSSVKPALHCAASLVEALGDLALPYVSELINDMFRAGLSNDLILCLQSMAECVPVQQNEIEDRMLQNIYMCLAGQASVQTPGAHSRDSIVDHEVLVESSKGSKRFMFQSSLDEIIYDPTSGKVQFQADAGTESSVPIINMGDDPNTVEALVLGLETLAFFGGSMSRVTTSGAIVQLLPFVQDVAACYLLHPNEVVRRASALTCIALLIPYGTSHTNQIGGFSGIIVEDVLEKLLRVAASDISPTVRLYVVRALDSRYDAYLCQSHHLQQLFLLLQDEALATKAASIRLLGRLAFLNPAPILPVLRRRLNELIVELECGAGTGRMREEATRLLSVFLRSVPLQRIVHPVLHTIVSALPLDKTAPPRLASASLEALGELAQVSGMALQPWIKDVMPHVLEIMEDRSSASKQRTSLRTLGQIAGSTGYVILPYVDYPELLSNATAILPATKRAPWSLRREVIRTLGILGAYDPDRYYETASRARKGGGGAYFEVDVNDNMNSDIFQGWEKVPVATPTLRNLPLPKGGITILQQQPKRSGSRSYSRGSIEEIRDDDETEPAYLFMYEQYAMVAQPVSLLPPDKRMTPSDDDFYPTVTIQALMRIFRDPSLAVHHGVVVQGIMFIFKSLGLRCVPYLGKVVPQMIHVLRTCGPSNLRESLLVQLAMLSTIVREHLRPYVADIFEVAEQLWSSRHVATIFNLVSNLAFATPNEFRVFIPKLVVLLVSTFDEVQVTDWSGAARTGAAIVGKGLVADQKLGLVLKGICNLKGVLGGYLRIIVSALLKLADSLASLSFSNHSSLPDALLIELSLSVYRTVSSLLENPASAHSKDQLICPEGKVGWKQTSENGLSTRAVQPLVRILRDKPPQSPIIGIAIIETLCVCASNIGGLLWVQLYDTVVRDAIMAWKATQIVIVQIEVVSPPHRADDRIASCLEHYDDTIDELMAPKTEMGRSATFKRGNNYGPREGVPFATSSFLESTTEMFDQTTLQGTAQTGISGLNRLKVNHVKLQRAWDVAQRASRDDWEEWMRRLGIQLLREAPSPSLHACASLAHAYQPLARELFCAAFACCWKELSEPYRANLVYALKTAFVSDVSPEILQMLLNLAEFMEQDPSGGLPIEISVLADLALKCRAYAKALHYTEREYNLGGSTACVESLISINGRLDFPEAALGVLKTASMGETDDGIVPITDERSADVSRHHENEMFYSVTWNTKDTFTVVNSAQVDLSTREELWIAKLGAWTEALAVFEEKLQRNPNDFDSVIGCMRCLISNGEWRKVLELADSNDLIISGGQIFDSSEQAVSVSSQRKAFRMCAQAAWRLGQWGELERYATQLAGNSERVSLAPIAGSLSSEGSLPLVDFDGAFYSAVLHVHRKEWLDAASSIDAARRAMDGRLTALMAESYGRAYPSMLTAQTLAELEEIIDFRKIEERAHASALRHPTNRVSAEEARKNLLSVWRKRLAGCRLDAEVHASILAVRSLVLGPSEEVESILLLSELSRQSQRYKFAERVLLDPLEALQTDLNGPTFGFCVSEQLNLRVDFSTTKQSAFPSIIDRIVSGELFSLVPQYDDSHLQFSKSLIGEAGGIERIITQYRLYFTLVRHMWHTDRKEEAISRLAYLSEVVDMVYCCENVTDTTLRVKCWLELGEWKLWRASMPGSSRINTQLQADVLTSFKRAILLDNCGYKAWHAWALLNFRIALQISEGNDEPIDVKNGPNPKTVRNHVAAAIKGFVSAINRGTKKWCASVQQDLLNLLTCLFKFGNVQDVASELNNSIVSVALEAWLGVLPQLLARIHIKDAACRSVLHPLLTRLGVKHPQALMYPLSVLIKSPVAERKNAAESLMDSLKNHSSELVHEALMVSSELIRVAILWLETWHEGLEDASRMYFAERNVIAMLELLLPLHEQLENGGETGRENDFLKSFGQDLEVAHRHVKDYMALMNGHDSSETSLLNQRSVEAEASMSLAWDIYYMVFRRINKQLPSWTKFELSQCSRALSRARSLELGVPGSYRVDGSYVKIEKFIQNVEIITSKQRPRKITLRGSDGKDYMFLLKAHEDLRQDERVMQMFGMVNALLLRDPQTRKHDLKIQRYAITPLSHNCGVVGWVPHCDTLHSLIRDYRLTKRIQLNMESREMLKIAPDYDLLTIMQKVEVFIEALKKTTGQGNDLYEIQWLKSTTSEEWLERRTKFTRSLAVMSMVGYILGLGDRHPSNLMLDKLSGRVLHIDFGDCFEMAINREKVPEKVPFRLTRMLVKAMEVAGIEGSYRSTCEKTMTVLRDSRDSLMAMLEAFVYDPLISWRLADLSRNDLSGLTDAVPPGHILPHAASTLSSRRSGAAVQAPVDGLGRSFMVDPITELPDEDNEDDIAEETIISNVDMAAANALAESRSQIYANMQAMAASIVTDSRIASIVVDRNEQAAVESSMGRSRIERSMRQREIISLLSGDEGAAHEEALNEKAIKIIRRVEDKLIGTDFPDCNDRPLDVTEQVQRLIVQATSTENLCQLFVGWCPFW